MPKHNASSLGGSGWVFIFFSNFRRRKFCKSRADNLSNTVTHCCPQITGDEICFPFLGSLIVLILWNQVFYTYWEIFFGYLFIILIFFLFYVNQCLVPKSSQFPQHLAKSHNLSKSSLNVYQLPEFVKMWAEDKSTAWSQCFSARLQFCLQGVWLLRLLGF